MTTATTGGGPPGDSQGDVLGGRVVSSEARAQMFVTEFTKLREEQFGRTTAQQGLLAVNLTGGAAFIAFAASKLESADNRLVLAMVLLLLPLLSSAFALAYTEQHYSIMKVGLYLVSDFEPRARDIAAPDVFLWHTFLLKYAQGGVDDVLGRRWRRTFALYMPACFFSPSVVALSIATLVVVQGRRDLQTAQWCLVGGLAGVGLAAMSFVIWLWTSSSARISRLIENAIASSVAQPVQDSVADSVDTLTDGSGAAAAQTP